MIGLCGDARDQGHGTYSFWLFWNLLVPTEEREDREFPRESRGSNKIGVPCTPSHVKRPLTWRSKLNKFLWSRKSQYFVDDILTLNSGKITEEKSKLLIIGMSCYFYKRVR